MRRQSRFIPCPTSFGIAARVMLVATAVIVSASTSAGTGFAASVTQGALEGPGALNLPPDAQAPDDLAEYVDSLKPDRPAQRDPIATTEYCIEREMAQKGIHGAALAIARNGEVVYAQGFGRKHKDLPDAVWTGTQFRIGSSTKMLTAAGLLRLVDRGQVDLDAPMSRYIPGIQFAEPGVADRVTIRDLLQHTSGLPDNSALEESDLYGKPDPDALGRWVLSQQGTRAYAPPGRFWNYSSANYMYAGHVIERVSGQSFQDYMKAEVFQPAVMLDTTMVASEVEARGNFAFGHWWDYFHPGTLRIFKPTEQDNWARHPTGYAHSTVGDLVRWASLLMDGGGEVISAGSTQAMTGSQVFLHRRADQYYGFGVFSNTYKSLDVNHHAGSNWGWMATVDWVPERRFAVATLTNGLGALNGSAYCAIEAFLTPTDAPPPGGSCPQDTEAWSDYVGLYAGYDNRSQPWQFEVTEAYGRLRITIATSSGTVINSVMSQDCDIAREQGPGSFRIDTNADGKPDQTITFIRDPIEEGVIWLRHRFFVGRKGPAAVTTPTIYLPWTSCVLRTSARR